MQHKILEQYLSEIEANLSDIAPSERSKIILENHRHILQAQENFPDKSLKEILRDLGTAQKVANHYRLDRGLKTFKPKRHPILKWLSITFLGSIATLFIFLGVLIWKFTPIAKFDEEAQRIILLGGMIDINGMSGKIKVFDQYQFIENRYTNQFEGSLELPSDANEVVVNFESGSYTISTTPTRMVTWNCKLQSAPVEDMVTLNESSLQLDFNKTGSGSCSLEIPVNSVLTLTGKDGQVEFLEPEFDLLAEMTNGNFIFTPSPEVEYNFDVRVESGRQANFESSIQPSAYEVKLYLKNGNVEKNHGP